VGTPSPWPPSRGLFAARESSPYRKCPTGLVGHRRKRLDLTGIAEYDDLLGGGEPSLGKSPDIPQCLVQHSRLVIDRRHDNRQRVHLASGTMKGHVRRDRAAAGDREPPLRIEHCRSAGCQREGGVQAKDKSP
jgi:hypothetical protein